MGSTRHDEWCSFNLIYLWMSCWHRMVCLSTLTGPAADVDACAYAVGYAVFCWVAWCSALMTQVVSEPAYSDIMRSLVLCSEGEMELYLRNPASFNIPTGTQCQRPHADTQQVIMCLT